jgi:hypothetical protein
MSGALPVALPRDLSADQNGTLDPTRRGPRTMRFANSRPDGRAAEPDSRGDQPPVRKAFALRLLSYVRRTHPSGAQKTPDKGARRITPAREL